MAFQQQQQQAAAAAAQQQHHNEGHPFYRSSHKGSSNLDAPESPSIHSHHHHHHHHHRKDQMNMNQFKMRSREMSKRLARMSRPSINGHHGEMMQHSGVTTTGSSSPR